MLNMQDKILSAIAEHTPDRLELAVQRQYANTGTIYAQVGFRTIVMLNYSFQSDYCSLYMRGEAVGASATIVEELVADEMGQAERDRSDAIKAVCWHYLQYADGPRIERMLQTWTQLCAWVEHVE